MFLFVFSFSKRQKYCVSNVKLREWPVKCRKTDMNCCSCSADGAPRCCHGRCPLSTCQPHFGSSLTVSGPVLIRSAVLASFSLRVFFFFFFFCENESIHWGLHAHSLFACFPWNASSETSLKLCFNSKLLMRFREIWWFWFNVEKVNTSSIPLYEVSTDFQKHFP